MRSLHSYRLPFALLVATLLGTAVSAPAEPLSVPKASPLYTVDVPKGWEHTFDKDGDLVLNAGDKSNYSVSLISLGNLKNKSDVKTALQEMAKSIGEKTKLSEFEVGDIEDTKNGDDVPFSGLRADGKSDDANWVIILHAFEPKKGRWFVMLTASPEKVDKAHEEDYNAIYDSIQPLK